MLSEFHVHTITYMLLSMLDFDHEFLINYISIFNDSVHSKVFHDGLGPPPCEIAVLTKINYPHGLAFLKKR